MTRLSEMLKEPSPEVTAERAAALGALNSELGWCERDDLLEIILDLKMAVNTLKEKNEIMNHQIFFPEE